MSDDVSLRDILIDISVSLDSIASSLRWLCLFFWLPVIFGVLGGFFFVGLLLSNS